MRRQDGYRQTPPLPVTGADANTGCWAITRYFGVEGAVGDCREDQDNVGSLQYLLDDFLHDRRVLVSSSVASAMDEALEYQTVICDLGVGLHRNNGRTAQLLPSTSPLSFHTTRCLLTAVSEVPNWLLGSSLRRS